MAVCENSCTFAPSKGQYNMKNKRERIEYGFRFLVIGNE
jgi:hypothetical protein